MPSSASQLMETPIHQSIPAEDQLSEPLRLLAGDQRPNATHFLLLVSQEYIRSKIKQLYGADFSIEIEVAIHTDNFGKANGNDRKILEESRKLFILKQNNIELESWMAAFQGDNLFRHDLSRDKAMFYAFEEHALDNLISTEFSHGLIPHPTLQNASTDNLPLASFPEIYSCQEQDRASLGWELLHKYFENIQKTSMENPQEIKERIAHIVEWIAEYKQLFGEQATHADLMKWLLGKVIGQQHAQRLTTTFEQYRLDRINQNHHFHTLLGKWLKNQQAEWECYNQAMMHDKAKHLLAPGEMPYWVSIPVRGQAGRLCNQRFTMYQENGAFSLVSEDQRIPLNRKNVKSIVSAAELAACIIETFPDVKASHMALIPKSHVFLSQMSVGKNLVVQPLKPAQYNHEVDEYAKRSSINTRTLFLKIDLWEILKENQICLPQELAYLAQQRFLTGAALKRLEHELQNGSLKRYIEEVIPLQVIFYQMMMQGNTASMPKQFEKFLHHKENLEFHLQEEDGISGKIDLRLKILNRIQEKLAEKPTQGNEIMFENLGGNNSEKPTPLSEKSNQPDQLSEADQLISILESSDHAEVKQYGDSQRSKLNTVLENTENPEKHIHQICRTTIPVVIADQTLKAFKECLISSGSGSANTFAQAAMHDIQESLKLMLKEDNQTIIAHEIENTRALLAQTGKEIGMLHKQCAKMNKSKTPIQLQKSDNPHVRLEQLEGERDELKKKIDSMNQLQQEPQRNLMQCIQRIINSLVKGRAQLDFASYYIDPMQLYIGWGTEAIQRAAEHIELSETPYL